MTICGRDKIKLEEAASKTNGIYTETCDISSEQDRIDLVKWVIKEFPEINVLINNVGIQHKVNLLSENFDWAAMQAELATNLAAPRHSFTITLRIQRASVGIKIIEIVPSAINIDLGGKNLHDHGVSLDEFSDAIIEGIAADKEEIGYGTSDKALRDVS